MSIGARGLGRHAALLTLVGVALLCVAPLVWMVSTSLKPSDQTMQTTPTLLPRPVSQTPRFAAENYSAVWTDETVNFPLYLRNTLVIAILGTIGMTLSSAIAAYGFARVSWRGRGPLFVVLLATMMVPFPVLMTTLYIIFAKIGWIGTFRPLWVPAFFGGAFSIFLLRQFFRGLPTELDEAARIDGCSHWGIFWRIAMPLSRPALAVVAILHFTYTWNDFIGPLIYLTHRDQFTLSLGLQMFQSKAGNTPWNHLMAASVMVVAPVLILFFLAQRTFVEGVSMEGLKE